MRLMTIGKATYDPGCKQSTNVNILAGTKFCEVEHLGMVISGSATVAFEDQEVKVLKTGDVFYVSYKHTIVGLLEINLMCLFIFQVKNTFNKFSVIIIYDMNE